MYKAATNDGLFAVDLKNKWPSDIVFLTDMFVFSSYFQPGRYSENAMKKFTVLKNFVS